MASEKGWRPIPLSLKVLFVIFILWAIGSIFAISARFEVGLPFFGMWVAGMFASLIVLILDIIAPLTFLFALWARKSWAATFAMSYITIFILNSIVAFFTFREQLGTTAILIPLVLNIIFLVIIYKKRSYFN